MRSTFLIFAACFTFARLTAQSIYELSEVMEVRIYFDRPDWDTYLDSLKQLGNDDRLEGQVVVNGIKYEKAGVRYKGNSSYYNVRNTGAAKLPFNIKVNYKNKRQNLPGGYTTLKLSNVFRDPSFLREVLSYEIAGKYMPAPRANFAKVFVNDEFLGLYNNTESVDEIFLRKYFADNSGPLLKCDPNWHAKKIPDCPEGDKASLMYLGEDSTCYMGLYELKTKTGWDDLIYLTKVLNKKSESLEQVMVVDQFLWMLAFNNVLVNLDSYTGRLCHNYYIYRDTLGFYHPIVWDMNLSLGGFRYTGLGSPLSNEKMQRLSPFVHYKQKNHKRPLITILLGNSLYRKIYIAHIRTILHENFSNAAYLKRAEDIRAMIDPLVQEDQSKLYSYEAFQDNVHKSTKAGKSFIIGIEELMSKRTEYLSQHPLLLIMPPVISEVAHIDYGASIAVNAKIEGTQKAWLYYRFGKEGGFSRLEMFDDSGHNDQLEADGIWGGTLEAKPNLQYYIVAEGEKSAALSPERASLEFYGVNLN